MVDDHRHHAAWFSCHASMGQCHATLLDVCASTANESVRNRCVTLIRCTDVCRHLCMCAIADTTSTRIDQMDAPHRHLMSCCAHRLESMVECCGHVVRACSDRAMRADGTLAKRILSGGGGDGPVWSDGELMDYLYHMFTTMGSNGDVQVENKAKSDDSEVVVGDESSFTRTESRSKQNSNNTNVLVNAFMKVLPNLVIATGDGNSVRAGHAAAGHAGAGRNAFMPTEMSRTLFERLLRDVKRVEDDALECIDLARARLTLTE